MKITISGAEGAGKSTVAKVLARKLGFKHYSIGDFMRELAKKRNIDLLKLHLLGEKDPKIDRELDDMQIMLGKEEDNFVLDSRLGFHFIPDSVKIYLDVKPEEAAKRIFNEGRPDEKSDSIEEMRKDIESRMKSNIKRFKKYYNLDFTDKKNFDLVIDTTDISIQKVVDRLLEFLERKDGR